MAGITTHVMNTVTGKPGAGMRIDFSILDGNAWKCVKTVHANSDGRTDEMILAPVDTKVGQYELAFHVAEHLRAQGVTLADPPFIDVVPVRFAIADPSAHYHVPMLFSPWSCATYRGS